MSSSFPQCDRSTNDFAPACAAGRYDEFASGKPDCGSGGGVASGLFARLIADRPKGPRSCRHILDGAIR
jgi:hypothetical protein